MKSILTAALTALAIGAVAAPVAPTAAFAQSAESAPVVDYRVFREWVDARQVRQFTGVSGGYVAFILCNGQWYRVRASTTDVVNSLSSSNYTPQCGGGDR